MKTPLGFDLTTVLGLIVDLSRWDEYCRSYAGGARWYTDPDHGEQSFHYQHARGKLKIEFVICERLRCRCPSIVDCNCHDDDAGYDTWRDYWAAHHETIILSKKQAAEYLTPNLFNQF